MMFLGNLNYVAIAVIGGLRVASGPLSLGDVQAFIQYSRQFTQPLTQLASMANVLQSGIASAERVFELLDVEEQSPDDPPCRSLDEQPRGRVEFEHVGFSYDQANPLIDDLSLVAEPGQTVAIVGPTGAGKTTLVNLLMRFYELDRGTIRLDGRDISQMRRRELRANLGMVLQDTWLFGGTIRENIAYGNLDATEDQIVEAARATYVDRFVRTLPDGYDTVLDDEGSNVSAGEKQLLTIARAFLADPTILILDEATSSVDTRTEVLIQHAMAALRSNRTSFVIAHRLSTIRDADTILVMEAGRHRRAGQPRTSCWPPAAPTTPCTTPSSRRPPPRSSDRYRDADTGVRSARAGPRGNAWGSMSTSEVVSWSTAPVPHPARPRSASPGAEWSRWATGSTARPVPARSTPRGDWCAPASSISTPTTTSRPSGIRACRPRPCTASPRPSPATAGSRWLRWPPARRSTSWPCSPGWRACRWRRSPPPPIGAGRPSRRTSSASTAPWRATSGSWSATRPSAGW